LTAAPQASVVVVTYDSAGHLPKFLGSLRGQVGVRHELVVVDNGSSDGSAPLVRHLAPTARIVEQANLGFGAGCNAGARVSAGAVLVFVNPDTVLRPGAVKALADATRPGTVATAKVLLSSDPSLINTCGNRLHFTGYSTTFGLERPAADFPADQPVPGVSGAAFAVRRDDWARVGGFDEDFFLYMEDTELSWRLRRLGFSIVLAAGAEVEHEYAFGVAAQKLEHLETGRLLLLRKHYRLRHWFLYAPSLLAAEAVAWGLAVRLGRAGIASKARAVRRGWRRGIAIPSRASRGPGADLDDGGRPARDSLAPLRASSFADRTLPFRAWVRSPLLRAAGGVANLVFWLNTLTWPKRSAP
jgi:GT2 family glycosyltransferase